MQVVLQTVLLTWVQTLAAQAVMAWLLVVVGEAEAGAGAVAAGGAGAAVVGGVARVAMQGTQLQSRQIHAYSRLRAEPKAASIGQGQQVLQLSWLLKAMLLNT
jgi:hypothetical protein